MEPVASFTDAQRVLRSLQSRLADIEAEILGYLPLAGGEMSGDISLATHDLLNVGAITGLPWSNWTPALTASITNPNIGSTGTALGAYVRIGSLLVGHGRISFGGTGIANGSGNYLVSLPENASTAITGQSLGSGVVFDASSARYNFQLERSGANTAFLVYHNPGANNVVTGAAPVATFVAGDRIQYWFAYQGA